MENNEEKHDFGDNLENSESLDVHDLHVGKPEISFRRTRTGNEELCARERTHSADEGSVAAVQSLGRSRRSTRNRNILFPNALQQVTKGRRNNSGISGSYKDGLDSGVGLPLYPGGSSSTPHISAGDVSRATEIGFASVTEKKGKFILACGDAQQPNTLCDDINIPRRPRGLLGRKRSACNVKAEPVILNSIGSNCSGDYESNAGKLTQKVGLLVGKRKRKNHGLKGSVSDMQDPVQHQDNCNIVQMTRERTQRNHHKRLNTLEKQKHLHGECLAFANVDDLCNNCPEDDEESLEQNAARMLSSRFDPNCTGNSGGKSRFSSKSSKKSVPRLPVIHTSFRCSELAVSSAENAGRALRPRKQSQKSYLKKQSHFYEVCSRGIDPYWVLKRRIRVFWPLDQSWYFGLVKDYDPITKLHHVKYDDREEEWTNLRNERIKLLLLPSELSQKSNSEKMNLKKKTENGGNSGSVVDDKCMDTLLESEPIISWLARAAPRVRASSLKVLKERRVSHVNRTSGGNIRKSSFLVPKRSANEKDNRKFGFVYFRRRFCRQAEKVGNKLESGPCLTPNSMKLPTFADLGTHDSAIAYASCKIKGRFELLLPLNCSLTWIFEDYWLYEIVSILDTGKLLSVWPVVCVEVVLLDNKMGLRFLTLEGCLQHAVTILCLLITVFYQPVGSGRFCESQVPFTSIGFRLSCSQSKGGQILFCIYNFLDLKGPLWPYVSHKLKHLAVTIKKLPPSECTYANVRNLLSSSKKRSFGTSWGLHVLQSLPKTWWEKFIYYLDPELSTEARSAFSYFMICGQNKSCTFSLPFCTAPALFLFLHFKWLMGKDVDCVSSEFLSAVPLLSRHPANCKKFSEDHSSHVEDSSDRFSETTHEYLCSMPNQAAVVPRWIPHPISKLDIDALSISTDGSWKSSCKIYQSNVLDSNKEATVHQEVAVGENGCDEMESQLQRLPVHKSWQDIVNPCSPLQEEISSTEESEGVYGSFLNTLNVNTQSNSLEDRVVTRESQAVGKSAVNLNRNTQGCTILSPNPTAPRTLWHRSRQNPASHFMNHHSKLLPRDWDGLVNGYKKQRTLVSYMSPFGGCDIGLKSRSHRQKGCHYRKLKGGTAKSVLAGSRNMDKPSSSCDANVLVTAGDRGWREYDAQVVLESDDQKDWRISVKVAGDKKFSYRAQQLLQPGTTNRFNHAMMWKGGKDWILEFTDRGQWSLFKEVYEQCHNRNIRSASFKNIPIPVVRLIEDCDDSATEASVFHSSPKYFRQKGTEVDMALDSSRILYDMDSEDEEWISTLLNSADDNRSIVEGMSYDMFEKTVDIFEKTAFTQGCDEFTDKEVENLVFEVGTVEVMRSIYEHWHRRRQKKGMPLIRQFQPALWEKYQQQLREWESTVSKLHISANGCHGKGSAVEKPPMFAFCLRPRGLEAPNKGSKQRSHKKLPVNGQTSTFARETCGFQGARSNGCLLAKEKFSPALLNHELSEITAMVRSPTGVSDNGSSGRGCHWRPDGTNNSKNMGMSASFPRDRPSTSMSFAKRMRGNASHPSNCGFPDWATTTVQHKADSFQRHRADTDEYALRDTASAAQHATNMAKLKRERAHWLMHKADLAIYKAAAALMAAGAIKDFGGGATGDG